MPKVENGKVWTGKVRLSYAKLFSPGDDGRYTCTLLIPKTDKATVQALKQAEQNVRDKAKEYFGGKVPEMRAPVYDGDGTMPAGGDWGKEAKGCIVVRAASRNKPGVVDLHGQEITDSTEVDSGCYARATINFYLYDNKTAGSKGLSVGLGNIQKVADGESLTGRARAEDDFADNDDWMMSDGDDDLYN